MMSRSPQTIQAQPLSLTFTEIWSSAGGGRTQKCSVVLTVKRLGQLTKPCDISKRKQVVRTVSHRQRLHHFDRQRRAEGLHVIVDRLSGCVALDSAGCRPDGRRDSIDSSCTIGLPKKGKYRTSWGGGSTKTTWNLLHAFDGCVCNPHTGGY